MQGKYMYEAHCSKNGKIKRTNVTIIHRVLEIQNECKNLVYKTVFTDF